MQHDNAPAHVSTEDIDVVAARTRGRSTILLDPQPSNSPDCKILDLGMFAEIESLRYEAAPRNV